MHLFLYSILRERFRTENDRFTPLSQASGGKQTEA